MWKVAVEQAFLATGVGFGAFMTIASYCKRSNNLIGYACLEQLLIFDYLDVVG